MAGNQGLKGRVALITGVTAELYDAVRAREPQGRWGQPEDAARLIAWLATDDACWITGQVINSTGGGP